MCDSYTVCRNRCTIHLFRRQSKTCGKEAMCYTFLFLRMNPDCKCSVIVHLQPGSGVQPHTQEPWSLAFMHSTYSQLPIGRSHTLKIVHFTTTSLGHKYKVNHDDHYNRCIVLTNCYWWLVIKRCLGDDGVWECLGERGNRAATKKQQRATGCSVTGTENITAQSSCVSYSSSRFFGAYSSLFTQTVIFIDSHEHHRNNLHPNQLQLQC